MKKVMPFPLLILILFISCVSDDQSINSDDKLEEVVVSEQFDETQPVPAEDWRTELQEYQNLGDMVALLKLLDGHSQDLELSERVFYLSLLVSDSRLEEAEVLGKTLLEELPEEVNVLYLNALVMDMEGRNDEAVQLIDQAYELDPSDPDVNLFLAELHLRKKDYNGASKYLNVILEQEPENFSALVSKADVLMHLGEGNDELNDKFLRDAVEVLNRVEEIAPDYVYTYVDRSRALAVLGNTTQAMRDLNRAIELEPDVEWHYLDRIVLNLKYFGHMDKALADIKSLEAINDNNLFAHIYGAGIYDDLKDYDTALSYYEKVMTARPNYAYSYEGAGKIYYMNEEYAKAQTCFLKAYELIYPYEGFILMAALSMKHQGDNFTAKEILSDGITSLDRESLMYEMFRYFIDGGSDFFITQEIAKETDKDMRNKAYYYLGEMSILQENPRTAQASFLNLSEEKGYFEADIANWHNRGVDE